eukprot:GHVP01024977.1.p1 GENE.GHVP01024977.1~~GHVP01024977.1.p1  ORF type:complete len:160 (+),score=17.52 GHVP01024977.1:401-880(+)
MIIVQITVEVFPHYISKENYDEASRGRNFDIIVDCVDHQPSKIVINLMSIGLGIPIITATALGWEGQLCFLNYKGGPCYKCVYTSTSAPTDRAVVGPVPGVVGSMQAIEALKFLLGLPHLGEDKKMLIFDFYPRPGSPVMRSVLLRTKRVECEACGSRP